MFHYKIMLDAIKLYEKYNSYKKVAFELSKMTKITRQTISNWYKKYQNILDHLAERIKKKHTSIKKKKL